MKKCFTVVVLLLFLFVSAASGEGNVTSLTYAVFPYLPDAGHYQELIERRWAEVEPAVELIRAEWDCYTDGEPEGIDVIVFDAVMLDSLVGAGWIQPIGLSDVLNAEDIFPFALDGLTVGGRLYGIPIFLCGNFLIYDQDCEAVAAAEHITDLADMSEVLVVNSGSRINRPQYIIEVIADMQGTANPSVDGMPGDVMQLIDRLAIDAHEQDDDPQVAMAYDSGSGWGYIGFSESMRLLEDRVETTRIKSISFSDQPDTHRLYVDAAAVTREVDGERYEKCLELMNIMADADILTALSVQNGAPQYLLLARRTPYQALSGDYPLYAQLRELAEAGDNHAILTP